MKAPLITLVILLGLIGSVSLVVFLFGLVSPLTREYIFGGFGFLVMFIGIRGIVALELETKK